MPRTGIPRSKRAASHIGAPSSDTLLGPPERMSPTGFSSRNLDNDVLNGTISEYTDSSRRRRAMSCVLRTEVEDENGLVRHDGVPCALPRQSNESGIIPQHIVAQSRATASTFFLALCSGLCPEATRPSAIARISPCRHRSFLWKKLGTWCCRLLPQQPGR